MVVWLRTCLLLAAIGLASLPWLWASEADNAWMVDETIPNLLRFNLKGQMVSSDISEYIHFKCSGDGADRSCEIDSANTDLTDTSELLNPSTDDSLHSYMSGVVLYFVIAIVAAVLIIILTILYLLARFAFCATCWCCCASDRTKKSYFPKETRFPVVVLMMVAFFAFMATALILCYTLGVKQILTGISDVPDAPYGIANIMYKFSLALQPTYIGIVSTVLLPTLRNVNTTLCSVVNWEGVITDLEDLESTVDNLPDFQVISDALTSISEATDSINEDIDAIDGDNEAYDAQKVVTEDAANLLIDDLEGLQTALDDLSPTVTTGQGVVSTMSADYVTFFGSDGPGTYSSSDQDGDIDSAEYDIDHTVRSDTAGEGIPMIDTLTDAAGDTSNSVQQVIDTTLDGDSSGIAALAQRLNDIYICITRLPDFDATADNLEDINTKIADMLTSGAELDDMSDFLADVQTNLDDIPDTDQISTDATSFFTEGRELSVESTQSHVDHMDTTLQGLPDQVDIIIGEVEKISDSIYSVVNPLYDLIVVQPRNFNRTIMENPFDTMDLFNTINETVHTAADAANEILPTLRDLKDALTDTLDISSFTTTLTNVENNIDDSLDDLDETGMQAAIEAGSIDTAFDTATSTTQLATFKTALENAEVPTTVITAFRDLQVIIADLETQLKRVAALTNDVGSDGTSATDDGDYWLMARGVCSNDNTIPCDDSSDCGGNACSSIGVFRCSESTTTCTADATCSSYCLADVTRATNLKSSLLALANSAVTDFNQDDVATNFDTLRTDAAAFDMDQMDSDLDGIQSDITAADTDIYVTGLNDFIDSLDDNDNELTDMLSSLQSGSSKISAVDYDSFITQLNDLQDQIDQGGDKLGEYIDFAEDIQSYIYDVDGALNTRFDELDQESMEANMDAKGFGPTLIGTAATFESTIEDVRALLKNNTFDVDRVELTNSMRDPAIYLDRATANPHTGLFDIYTVGSLYYFMQMANATAELMVNARDPLAYTITKDINGDSYPDSKFCVTKKCFENQQDDMDSSYGQYIPLVLIPLAIVALIGLINVLCAFGTCSKTCRNCCPKILICWIIVITPLYLIGSGFLFTFLIALSDGCTGGPKIAANYIQAYGDDLCVKLEGKGTLDSCHIIGNDFDVTVDINRMSDVILGLDTCSGSNDDDPFYYSLNALAEQMQESSVSSVRKRVYNHQYRKYRPTVKNIVLDAVDGGAQVTHDFVQDMGDDVLTCENMQSILDYFTSPVCYSLVGPATWMVATIYLCAWAMCCLGIPAACALKNHYKWSDIEERRRKEEDSQKKSAKSSMDLLRNYMLASRRGRGMLATRRGKHIGAEDDLEKIELEIQEDEDNAQGLGAHAAAYHEVSVEPGAAAEGFLPPPAGPGKGYFAYYPKTSSKEMSYTKEEAAAEAKHNESDSDGEHVELGGKQASKNEIAAPERSDADV